MAGEPPGSRDRRLRRLIVVAVLAALAAFLAWRFVRPLNIFVVSPAFERPISVGMLPAAVSSQRAQACGACHRAEYDEWRTSMHSRAWTDSYFQVDWRFEGSEQICRNCHTPLEDQQEHRVLGFRDSDKWDPILEPNPQFDPVLQNEGVTCSACHLREGAVLGPYGEGAGPHPVRRIDPNQVCVRCHVVSGKRWDTFYRVPPCGTVAEIEAAGVEVPDCVGCHMPAIERPLMAGGAVRSARRHLWRGGHDRETVRRALAATLREEQTPYGTRRYALTLVNSGTTHYLPTGTPDRHLTVSFRILDASGAVLDEQAHTLRRTVMWRPFIVDLWDTRLPYATPRTYAIEISSADRRPASVEAVVRYHLLDEARRQRIGYRNTDPIAYEIFRERRIVVHDH